MSFSIYLVQLHKGQHYQINTSKVVYCKEIKKNYFKFFNVRGLGSPYNLKIKKR